MSIVDVLVAGLRRLAAEIAALETAPSRASIDVDDLLEEMMPVEPQAEDIPEGWYDLQNPQAVAEFSAKTGLRVHYSKDAVICIRLDEQEINMRRDHSLVGWAHLVEIEPGRLLFRLVRRSGTTGQSVRFYVANGTRNFERLVANDQYVRKYKLAHGDWHPKLRDEA